MPVGKVSLESRPIASLRFFQGYGGTLQPVAHAFPGDAATIARAIEATLSS